VSPGSTSSWPRSTIGGSFFLAWLNCAALGPDDQARERFLDHGRVALEPGLRFGAAGSGYARLNFATSSEILDQATARMAESAG
jgi:cystathionine beta-lyase